MTSKAESDLEVQGLARFKQVPLTGVVKFNNADATPDVRGCELGVCNSAAVTITNFKNGFSGQRLYIIGHANTIIKNNSNITTSTGSDKTLSAKLYCFLHYNGKWYELADSTGVSGSIVVDVTEFNVAFTDGDTLKRVTVTDAAVVPASKIVGTIRRPNVSEADDRGYIYTHNIVNIGTGSFDVLIACLGWGFDDPTQLPPNETIVFSYILG